jgi:uncharacterized protein YjiS (DUF1127 family)
MAYANDIRSQSGFSFADRFSGLFRSVSEARAKRVVYVRTLRELEALSSRDLADLGIARAMIQQLAREAAYGK